MTTTRPELRTKAGRALLRRCFEYRLWAPNECESHILAIEAEAAAPAPPKAKRIDWSNVVVDEGDEAP